MDRKPRLLVKMRKQTRVRHYSISTEQVHCQWRLAGICQSPLAEMGRFRLSEAGSFRPLADLKLQTVIGPRCQTYSR